MKSPLLFIAFLAPLAISSLAAPAQSVISSPRSGEIALEGTIESLDVVKNSITLRATSFALGTGAAKKLPQAKSKVIRIGDATQFVGSGGTPNLSLGDLERGQKIRVVGREVAGKPLVARLVTWRRGAAVLKTDPLTPPDIAPLLPAPQRAFSVKLQPINAAWTRRDLDFLGRKEKTPVFTTTWRISSPLPRRHGEHGGPLPRFTTAHLVGLSAPDGSALETVSSDSPDDSDVYDPSSTQISLSEADVNPNWPFINVEWDVLDPAAGDRATGKSQSILKWDGVKVPAKVGQKSSIQRDMMTSTGTKIRLLSVERVGADADGADADSSERLSFECIVVAGTRTPDAQIEMSPQQLRSPDGTFDDDEGGSIYSDNTHFRIESATAPPAKVKSLRVSLLVMETAPSLQKRSQFKRLKFQIPVAPIWKLHPVLAAKKSVIAVETAHVRGQLESVRVDDNQNWSALLWLQSPAGAPDAEPDGAWRYFLQSGRLTERDGQSSDLEPDARAENRRFVHLDGQIAAPGERAQLLSGGVETPESFSLQLDFDRGRRLSHFETLKNIPLPATPSNREWQSDAIATDFFALRRVIRYENLAAFPGLNAQEQQELQSQSGIALVVEISPLFPGASLDFRVERSFDPAGRQWSSNEWLFSSFEGDLTQKNGAGSRLRTIFLPDPGTSSRSISLDCSAIETQWSNQSETVTLHNLLPASPSSP